ncbi:unnamed protein product, partial [Musa textilis]
MDPKACVLDTPRCYPPLRRCCPTRHRPLWCPRLALSGGLRHSARRAVVSSAGAARAYSVPLVVEHTKHGEMAYDVFSRLLKERIVCVNGAISDEIAAVIVAQLLFLESQNPSKTINMYVNSPGGAVTAGLAIYDTMRYINSPVSTLCLGQAASMGSLLLAAGATGERRALPHSRIMIHQPSGGTPARPLTSPSRSRRSSRSAIASTPSTPATPGSPSSGSISAWSATRSCLPKRPRSLASSTRSSCTVLWPAHLQPSMTNFCSMAP